MFSKTVLFACVAFCFLNYCSAKLELVLAIIQEPTDGDINVDQAAKAFACGRYLADKYKRGFQITDGYTETDLDVIAVSSTNAKETALMFKQGVLSKKYWRYKNYNQEVYNKIPEHQKLDLWAFTRASAAELAKVSELDNKFLMYQNDCPAFWEEIVNPENHCRSELGEKMMMQASPKVSQNSHTGLDIWFTILNNMDFNLKMKRLSAGPLLHEIMTSFNTLTKEPVPHQKILLYVLPPELMACLVLSFSPPGTRFNKTEIEDQVSPKYGSTLVVELRSNDTIYDDWTIKLQYRNEDKDLLQPIRLPDCGIKCPVRIVYEKLKPYMTQEAHLRKECKAQNTKR